MMPAALRTIRAKIIGMILLATAFALVAAGALLSLEQYRALHRNALQQVTALAQVVAANSAAAISFRDEKAAQATLATLDRQTSLREARIVTPEGDDFASWISAAGPVAADDAGARDWVRGRLAELPQQALGRVSASRLDVVAPVAIDRETVAMIHLVADTGTLRAQVADYARGAATAAVLALAIAALLSSLLHRAITDRIAAIIAAMARVRGSGDYRIRLPAHGRDEIADLTGGFNAMLAELSLRDDQLAAHRRDLERQVEERTAALVAANATLERSNRDLQSAQVEIRRLALVAQSTGNAVIVCGGDGRVQWVNDAFARMTGHSLDSVAGKRPIDFLFGPDTAPATLDAMQVAHEGRTHFSGELVSYTRARQPIWLSMNTVPVIGADGAIEQIVTVAVDVTALRRQEERLAEALEREREIVAQQKRFIAVAAHEFRTPLTIIDGAAQRLARNADAIAPGDLRERVERIRRAVARMGQLIDTTLNSARLDAGMIEMNAVVVDVAALVSACAHRLGSVAAGFDLRVEGAREPLSVLGDHRLLDQVFTNLLSNAIKYSGDGRRVDVTLARGVDDVRVEIRDYGIGVPEAELPKLFTRFFRATTAKGLPGTGIGLNLVKELVALHGGEVRVRSKVGAGSTFIVTLPLAAETDGVCDEAGSG
jgi:PAS domain S-box-containing protein